MNQMIPFIFDEKPVRTVMIGDSPWWVGKDVCNVLGYKDTVNALKQHCRGVVKHHPLATGGGTQEVRVISEGDVFRLIVSSRLPEARRFEKWLFEEVLPQIRKTGSYVPETVRQDIENLRSRILDIEIDRSVTEERLLRSERTIRRYEEQRLMTYEDKREILALSANKYPVSMIQRITKKSRGAIKRFFDEFYSLDDDAFEEELEKIGSAGEDFFSCAAACLAASRGRGRRYEP